MNNTQTTATEQPNSGSKSLKNYYLSYETNIKLFFLFVDTIVKADYMRFIAEAALNDDDWSQFDKPEVLASKNPGTLTLMLRKSKQELLQMFVARSIDNFQSYLVDILREILKKKPEILSARKQEISVSQILKFNSIEDLVLDIIESKINSLSYEGFGSLQKWCNSNGIPLHVPKNSQSEIVEYLSLRNIIVHNRGIIDSRFINATNKRELIAGEAFKLEVDYFYALIDLVNKIVFETDKSIVSKFNLAVEMFDIPDNTNIQ